MHGRSPHNELHPPFSIDQVRAFSGLHKPHDVLVLLNAFCNDSAKLVYEIETAIAMTDASALRDAAHALKGSALAVTANAIAEQCKRLEACAEHHSACEWPKTFAPVFHEIERIHNDIFAYRVEHQLYPEDIIAKTQFFIADPSKPHQRVVSAMLKTMGAQQFHYASSVDQATEQMAQHEDGSAIVIVNETLSRDDCLSLCRTIRTGETRIPATTPIVVFRKQKSSLTATELLSLGVNTLQQPPLHIQRFGSGFLSLILQQQCAEHEKETSSPTFDPRETVEPETLRPAVPLEALAPGSIAENALFTQNGAILFQKEQRISANDLRLLKQWFALERLEISPMVYRLE